MTSFDLSLYLVLDPDLCRTHSMVETTMAAIAGGATIVQLRDKKVGTEGLIRIGRELMDAMAGSGVPLIVNDGMAIGVIVAAKELGLRVPEDVSVFGFDDIHLAAAYDPPLTTVRQPRRRLGEQAIALLLDRLDPKTPNKTGKTDPVIVPTELIIRQSTGPCPQG